MNFDELLEGVEGRVTEGMNAILRCDYSEEEVLIALNQMRPLKAPGPDDMNGLFYQTYWHIVGKSVVLSSLLRRAVERATLHEIKIVSNAPMVSHLFFADDSIFFVKAKREEAACVKAILENYAAASGQLVNYDKPRYKLCQKLQGWRGQLFSKAGREVLIKAVAQSIPTYAMSVFKLPASFYDELRSIVSRFWWGSANGRGKIPWVAWSKLCKPKGLGGLGFRDFNHFNMALLGKQAWQFLMERSSLMVRVLGGKYCPNGNFLRAKLGNNPSYTWRGIWEAREVIRLGIRRRVGDGLSTCVWTNPWIPGTQTRMFLSPRRDADVGMMVANLWTADGKDWDSSKVRRFFLPFEHNRIFSMRIISTKPMDAWTWDFEKDGEYSVKSAYKLLTKDGVDVVCSSDLTKEKALWNSIWKANVNPKVKVFMWQFCNDAIATRRNLASRIRSMDVGCPSCGSEVETSLHLVRGYGWVGGMWDRLGIEVKAMDGYERARNRWVFENEKVDGARVARRVESLRRDMMGYGDDGEKYKSRGADKRMRRSGKVSVAEVRRWSKPGKRVVKLNVDAGTKDGCGTGMVCRGSDGEVIWGSSEMRREELEPRVAEAVAVLEGVKEARRRGVARLIVESDCKVLIDALKTGAKGRSDFHLVLVDILSICSEFNFISWSFVGMNCNSVAHVLAHVESARLYRKMMLRRVAPAVLKHTSLIVEGKTSLGFWNSAFCRNLSGASGESVKECKVEECSDVSSRGEVEEEKVDAGFDVYLGFWNSTFCWNLSGASEEGVKECKVEECSDVSFVREVEEGKVDAGFDDDYLGLWISTFCRNLSGASGKGVKECKVEECSDVSFGGEVEQGKVDVGFDDYRMDVDFTFRHEGKPATGIANVVAY
ncbi:uncharacterized protein LOC141646518 [Silene latifolia]|uniref:uncharacterized protein LOC141646518 n=1 Tax=Silene latifolia TaxID=37657 RepID=UPI003D775465